MKSFMIVSLRILGSERTKLLTNRKISVSTSPNGLPRPIHLELVNFFLILITFQYFSIHLKLVLLFIANSRSTLLPLKILKQI